MAFLKRHPAMIAAVLIILFSFFVHARLPNIADADSFYHLKHAWLYKTEGISQSAFPWTQYSSVNKYSADLWYGFHILLIPLTYLADQVQAIKIGEFLVTIIALLMVYWAFRKLKLEWPLFWLALFALATADLLYRIMMLRPHPLSLGLTILLFAFLQERPSKVRGLFPLFVIAILFSWIHISLSWLPILLVLALGFFNFLQNRYLGWRGAVAVFSGLILGWLARPNPFGAAKLAYIQVVKLLLEKSSAPLRFGRELMPFYWENFVDQLIPMIILLLTAIAYLAFLKFKTKPAAWSSLAMAAIFFGLTFAVARRSNEIFIAFAVIFIGLLATEYFGQPKNYRPFAGSWQVNLLAALIFLTLVYMPFKTIYRFDTYAANAFDPTLFWEASVWLKQNSQPGEIVFNIHWDRFGQLFFWNHQNYYINGMDPIFEYDFNPSLYWKTHFYAIDAASAFTCGKIRCEAGETEETHRVLKQDFRASYIVVEKLRSPKLYKYLLTASGFKSVFETPAEIVFKIL